jgi:hypothetical protein
MRGQAERGRHVEKAGECESKRRKKEGRNRQGRCLAHTKAQGSLSFALAGVKHTNTERRSTILHTASLVSMSLSVAPKGEPSISLPFSLSPYTCMAVGYVPVSWLCVPYRPEVSREKRSYSSL